METSELIVKVTTKRQICEILSKEIRSLKRIFLPQKVFRPQRYFLGCLGTFPIKKNSPHSKKLPLGGEKYLLRGKISFEREKLFGENYGFDV